MSDTPDIITLRAWLETANTRITELEQQNRYLDMLNYELQFMENKVILELKEDNARGALYVEHLKARIEKLEHEIVRLRAIFPEVLRRLGSGACAPDCSVEFLSQIPNEVGLVTDALRARIAELKKNK